MASGHTVTVYGTVMSTYLHGRDTVHRVEATSPGGGRIELTIVARKRHRGAVRVVWDPTGAAEPRFVAEVPWATIGLMLGIVAVIVIVGWLVLA